MISNEWLISILSLGFTALQTIVVIIATILALRQLREGTKTRKAEIIDRAFSYASSSEIRNARRSVRSRPLPSNLNRLSKERINDIELTLIGWARIGILVEMDVFDKEDKDILLRAYSWSIDNTWANLKGYIKHERDKTGMPDLWDNFEFLAKISHSWRLDHGLPTWDKQNK